MKKLTIILAILFLGSCSFLDVRKLGKSTIENYFTDISAIEQSIIGLYNFTYDVYNSYQILYPEIAADGVKIESSEASWDPIYRFNAQEKDEATAVGYIWKNNYEIIINANYVIFYANKFLKDNPKDEAKVQSCLSQAYFLKALAELNLCLAYSQHYSYTSDASHLGIVLIDGLPNLTKKFVRSSAADSYKDIMHNLDLAESLAHDELRSDKVLYAGSDAIKALKARVYLYMEDYSKALDLSSELIGRYSLSTREEYTKMFNTPGAIGKEEILSLDGYSQNSSLARFFSYQTHSMLLSENLKATFDRCTDISKDIRYSLCEYNGVFGINHKYNSIIEWDDNNRYYNIHILRLSEMYLIRAEAALNLGDQAQAIDDIKTLRARAQGVDKSNINVSSDDLLKQILDERFIELFCEGHRLYDLVRTRQTIEKPYVIADSRPLSMSYPSDYFVLPIPYIEIESNNIIQPNPGVNSTQR